MTLAHKDKNRLLSRMEIEKGSKLLSSTPQYVTVGAHYKCNAKCIFCLGGDYPDFTLDIYKSLIEKKLYEVLKSAQHVGYCGFGEILLMRDIEVFVEYIHKTLPDTQKVFTTNGLALTPALSDRFAEGNYSILVSLHASNPVLHEQMTGIKAFDKIIKNIEYLKKAGEKNNKNVHINLIFLLTSLNIDDLPEFVNLAENVGADRVTCNYLTIFDPAQVELSCFFAKEKTNSIMEKALQTARDAGVELHLPPFFGSPDEDRCGVPCTDPWEFFYVETQGSVLPCCNAGGHIGYLDKDDFETIWNGQGYMGLRESLVSGQSHEWCRYCMKHRRSNVNDIRGHITFRPETQKEVLDFIGKNSY